MAAQVTVREYDADAEVWVTVYRDVNPGFPAGISTYPPGCGVPDSARANQLFVRELLARKQPGFAELLADMVQALYDSRPTLLSRFVSAAGWAG